MLVPLVRARDARLRRQRKEVAQRHPRHIASRVWPDGGEAAGGVVDGVGCGVDGGEYGLAVDEELDCRLAPLVHRQVFGQLRGHVSG